MIDLEPLSERELAARVAYFSGFAEGVRPRPNIPLDVWADRNVVLARGEGREYGPWRTDRTPYVRDLMRCLSIGSPTQRHCVMKAAQMGYTQVVKCWIGYLIDLAPQQILFYLPTRDVAKQTKRMRIDPLIDGTEVLRERVTRSGSRSGRNSSFDVAFAGGMLSMRGANSAAAFRNISSGILVMDDVDGWTGEVGKEGDPITLLRKRAATYPDMKELMISTPTLGGLSRIGAEYELSDQRRWFLPCPHCGEFRPLTWSGYLDFIAKEGPGQHFIEWRERMPETAYMRCGACHSVVEEREKPRLYERAEWRATNPEGRFPGWHLPAMCAPLGWSRWGDLATSFLETKGNPLALKGFVNTTLAETYEEKGYGGKATIVTSRLEDYGGEVPDGVGVLVSGVDTQDDRLEVKVKGYGAGEESWLIAFRVLEGDPAQQQVWWDLDEYLQRAFLHVSGKFMHVECCAIDSGGHKTDHVYRFCKTRNRRFVSGLRPDGTAVWARRRTREQRVVAVRGGGVARGKEIVGPATRNNQYRVPLYQICTDSALELVYGRLQITLGEKVTRRPGYMHFPINVVTDEYAEQLMAKRGHYKYVKGKGTTRVWIQTRERDEALACEQYALAALHILDKGTGNVISTLARRAEFFSKREPGAPPPAPPMPPADPTPAPPAPGRPPSPSATQSQPAPPATRRQSRSTWPRRKGYVRNW